MALQDTSIAILKETSQLLSELESKGPCYHCNMSMITLWVSDEKIELYHATSHFLGLSTCNLTLLCSAILATLVSCVTYYYCCML